MSLLRQIGTALAIAGAAGIAVLAQTRPAPPGPVRDPGGRRPDALIGTASISGLVTSSGRPLAGARVALNGQGQPFSRTDWTDEQGRFQFTSLPAGRYTVHVAKPGYVGVAYGQRRMRGPGATIALTDGESRALAIQLPRGSVITGIVLDDRGEPAINTHVRAMRFVMVNGRRQLRQTAADTTDDRGVYRIHSLDPGEYVVCANPRGMGMGGSQRMRMQVEMMRNALEEISGPNAAATRQQLVASIANLEAQLQSEGPSRGYAPVCHGGTSGPAGTVAVGLGEEVAGVDIRLHLTPVARIEGFVLLPSGAGSEPGRIQITMSNTDAMSPMIDTQGSSVDRNGRFAFYNVAPGNYRIVARTVVGGRGGRGRGGRGQADGPRLWAMADVAVAGEDITDIALQLQPGMSISGQLIFQGATQAPPSNLASLRVRADPINRAASGPQLAQSVEANADSTGRFRIDNVMPGEYRLSASGIGSTWTLDSLVVGGLDVLDFPFEVRPGVNVTGAVMTYTDQITELSGRVVDPKGQPVADHTVLLFAADGRYWTPASRRVRQSRTQPDGSFEFRGIPPGDYWIAALPDVESGAWQDPGFLEQLAPASAGLTLMAGEKKVQNLQVSP